MSKSKDETDEEIIERMSKLTDKLNLGDDEVENKEMIVAIAKLVDDKMRDMLIRNGYLKPTKLH